ncbi:STAS domain-containing protein [Agaribacterium haliotis]|uniref:STAS domain-containing protein n=1 Tax=Agaribacterium haliotis TaxID=2013869 RepID=UPI000BB52D64|nr:STAS domain-containing protein [Agaribacterium haliotis]
MPLSTRVEPLTEAGLLRVHLGGSLDGDTAKELDVLVNTQVPETVKTLVFDMAELEYISSAGLRSIFMALKKLQLHGGKVAVVNRKAHIEKVFDIVKAIPDLQIFASWEEMDAYLDAMQSSRD